MEPLDTLYRWSDRMRDRARTGTFLRFLWRRFLDDRLFESAGALSFTMVFALVPLSMVVFGVLSMFPAFNGWSDQLSDYIFSNFVPGSARAIESHLRDFSRNTGQLTAVGVIALVVSLLVTLLSIEATFNKVWRVKTARRSEEHTSELQSLMRISYAGLCLKKQQRQHPPHNNSPHNIA